MGVREMPEQRQYRRPDADEEEEDEGEEGACRGIGGGEEVDPVAAVRGGEEEVLEEDGDKEPDDDAAFHHRMVEGWDAARGLTVVVWETKVNCEAEEPEEDGDWGGDGGEAGAVGDKGGGLDAGNGELGELAAPEPEDDDVDLLGALDYAGAKGPSRYWDGA